MRYLCHIHVIMFIFKLYMLIIYIYIENGRYRYMFKSICLTFNKHLALPGKAW